jgi:hypothetical protein
MNFTVSGSNIANGTYYYRASNVFAKSVATTVTGGSNISLGTDVANLAIGMTCSNPNVPGTITFIGANNITMSLPVTGTIASSTVLHFAQPSVFADFSSASQAAGSVSVSSNSGAFTMQLATDADTTNDVYTISLYTTATNTVASASTTITIQDSSPTGLVALPVDQTVTNTDFVSTLGLAAAGIRFKTDGTITINGTGYASIFIPSNLLPSPFVVTREEIYIGDWVTDKTNLNSANYSVSATHTTRVVNNQYVTSSASYTVTPATTPTGSLSLSQNREFTLFVNMGSTPASGSLYQVETVFTITVTGPSNSDTIVITALATTGNLNFGSIFG